MYEVGSLMLNAAVGVVERESRFSDRLALVVPCGAMFASDSWIGAGVVGLMVPVALAG